jgi:hypothetical protein
LSIKIEKTGHLSSKSFIVAGFVGHLGVFDAATIG